MNKKKKKTDLNQPSITESSRSDLPPIYHSEQQPLISVIILNYKGGHWMHRCLESIRQQTLFSQIETLVADNLSEDGSEQLCCKLLQKWPPGSARFIQNGGNFGYCKGNNLPAAQARGKWLLFLNNDTWFEPETLEKLLADAEKYHVTAAVPRILDYDSDNFQSLGAEGFDLLGFPTCRKDFHRPTPVLMPEGCAYLVLRETFKKLGGFDENFFMYADELDLSWRIWLAGGTCMGFPGATLHHRGAAYVNSSGGEKIIELRTSDTKRFYANRNNLLVLLKQSGPVLWPIILLQILWLTAEGIAGSLLLRRISFFTNTVWAPIKDCWQKRSWLSAERQRLTPLRRHSDLWMIRHFLRLRLNRWDEFLRIRRLGLPKVSRH